MFVAVAAGLLAQAVEVATGNLNLWPWVYFGLVAFQYSISMD